MGYGPGGFRTWWRQLHAGSGEHFDDTHLMRMAGRFARRVKAWAAAGGVPLIYCKAGECRHLIAAGYLEAHSVGAGVFFIVVARAPAPVWKVKRPASGIIASLEKKTGYVSQYSFRIMDPAWGDLAIKMPGHPPSGALVILNEHEYVACAAQAAGIGFAREDNCFTGIADPRGLAQIAGTLSQPAATGRLSQVCNRWICSACLCFALDTAGQRTSGFRCAYPVSRPGTAATCHSPPAPGWTGCSARSWTGTCSRLDVPALRTMSGTRQRPAGTSEPSPKLAVVTGTPRYDLTLFRVHFGLLTPWPSPRPSWPRTCTHSTTMATQPLLRLLAASSWPCGCAD